MLSQRTESELQNICDARNDIIKELERKITGLLSPSSEMHILMTQKIKAAGPQHTTLSN